MKKAVRIWLALLLCFFTAFPAAAAEEGYKLESDISAQAVYLYHMENESMIYAKNADEKLPPASLTKVMTCILALEHTDDLDAEILTYPAEIQDYLYNYQQQNGGISLAGNLRARDQMTMRQALYALMLRSANEVAMIIADHIGGSQEGFAAMMNEKARELGATNTNFVNPNGLHDPAHVSTARDLALITQYALENPTFKEISSTVVYESGPIGGNDNIVWESTNQMMNPDSSFYYPSVSGVKTGTLPNAGHCFVSTATKDGYTYLLVVLGCETVTEEGRSVRGVEAFIDSAKIYDEVFATFKNRKLVDKGKNNVAEIPLRLSMDKDHIKLKTADQFTTLLPDTVDLGRIEMEPVFFEEELIAPVYRNQHVGELILRLDGEELGRVDLLAQESVEASPFLVLLEKVLNITRSFWFKFIVIFVILLIVAYLVLTILFHRRRRRKGYKPRRRI